MIFKHETIIFVIWSILLEYTNIPKGNVNLEQIQLLIAISSKYTFINFTSQFIHMYILFLKLNLFYFLMKTLPDFSFLPSLLYSRSYFKNSLTFFCLILLERHTTYWFDVTFFSTRKPIELFSDFSALSLISYFIWASPQILWDFSLFGWE